MAKAGGKSSIRSRYGQDESGADDAGAEKTAYTWTAEVAAAKQIAPALAPKLNLAMGGKGGNAWEAGASASPWEAGAQKAWGKGKDKGWGNEGPYSKGGGGGGKDPWSAGAGGAGGAWGKGQVAGGMAQWSAVGKPQWVEIAERYPGLLEAVKQSCDPVAHLEDKWSADEMMQKITKSIVKAGDQFAKDERLVTKGSPIQSQAMVEEFVEDALGQVSQVSAEKAWTTEIVLAAPLCLIAETIFKSAKLFSRMLMPMLHKYVEDAVFRHREEARMMNAIWETIEQSGLRDQYHKKCNQCLVKAYDESHISAPFGTCQADKPEAGLLCDFVKGWMSVFVGRGWDILENGVGGREEQVVFVTNLFQILCHPERNCLPHDLVASLDTPLPPNWPFVAQTAIEIFLEADAPSRKKQWKSKGDPRGGGW